jgi:hypothetical protein
MHKIKIAFVATLLFIFSQKAFSQQSDSLQQLAKKTTTFSGSVGITNNGFSIVPTFSLNSPATITQLSIRKNKFSFDPDFRFTINFKKGGMVFWFRYHLITKKKYSLRIGSHPAFNFALRNVTENGVTTQITQARRFIANEIAQNYQIRPNWGINLYYLNGNGLQKDGPILLHFVNLATVISNIKVGGNFRMTLIPAVYYLNIDGKDGQYFTATGVLSNKKLPLSISSSVNQIIKTNIGGGKDFLWNVGLNYHFNKKMVAVK